MHLLKIRIADNCPNRDYVSEYYENKVAKISYANDCGVDLVCPTDLIIPTNKVTRINLGIECEFIPTEPYDRTPGRPSNADPISGPFMLAPRSSISSTPLSLANSIGIIDPGYRGVLMGAVRCHVDRDHESTLNDSAYKVNKGDRLFQIVAFDGKPIKVVLTDTLSHTDRGTNGFGSTNK